MEQAVRFLSDIHAHNLPFYALVTVLSVGLVGVAVGGLSTRLLHILGAGALLRKGDA